MRKTLMVAISFVVITLGTAQAQVSRHRLATQESAFGLGLGLFEDASVISGILEYGIDKNLKGYAYGAIGFIDGTNLSRGTEIPPAPEGGLGVMHVAPFGTTGFDSFLSVQGAVAFARVVDDYTTLRTTRVLALGGTAGLLKRLPASESGIQITPFFGISYGHAWVFAEDKLLRTEDMEDEGDVGAILGIETYLSKSLILSGTFGFSFESSDTYLQIGLTFY